MTPYDADDRLPIPDLSDMFRLPKPDLSDLPMLPMPDLGELMLPTDTEKEDDTDAEK